MAEYQDYPAWMEHPGMRQAVVDPKNPRNNKAAALQPLTVNSADQQEEYEAKGYKRVGTPNPKAFQTLTASPQPADYVFQAYPKWVGDVIVQNAEEEAALTAKAA